MIHGHTHLLFVFGHPVSHSLSPLMHNEVLGALSEDICYLPLHVLPQQIEAAVNMLRMPNVLGANVTIPHKESVVPFLDGLSDESKSMGAVNTVYKRDGKLWGTTTDPDGILCSLDEEGTIPNDRHVVIVGSGGSARTVAFALAMKARCKSLHMAARAPYKLEPIAAELKQKLGAKVTVSSTIRSELEKPILQADLLINCTSAGMKPHIDTLAVDPALLRPTLAVYDLVYNPLQTKLLCAAESKGCKAISGLGMLLHQGRRSLEIWLGREVPLALFPREKLIRALNASASQ